MKALCCLFARYWKLIVQNLTKISFWEAASIVKNIVKILHIAIRK